MANQHTTSTMTGVQSQSGKVDPDDLRDLWLERGRLKIGEDGCWEWQGSRDQCGYGRIVYKAGSRSFGLVHRLVYWLCNGEIRPEDEVCHHCDNPPCCNPGHLFRGSHTENMRDAGKKGRIKSRDIRGENSPAAKLTVEAVRDIRRNPDQVKFMQAKYDVCRQTISRVLSRKIWHHVD
jgi:hypothetical protein